MPTAAQQQYHISKDGMSRICTANIRDCGLKDSPHGEFNSPQEAQAWAEQVMSERMGGSFGGARKRPRIKTDENGFTESGKKSIAAGNRFLSAEMDLYEGKEPEKGFLGRVKKPEYSKEDSHKAALFLTSVLKNGSDVMSLNDNNLIARQLSAAAHAGVLSEEEVSRAAQILKEKAERGEVDLNSDPNSKLLAEARGEIKSASVRAAEEQLARRKTIDSEGHSGLMREIQSKYIKENPDTGEIADPQRAWGYSNQLLNNNGGALTDKDTQFFAETISKSLEQMKNESRPINPKRVEDSIRLLKAYATEGRIDLTTNPSSEIFAIVRKELG